MWEVQDVFIKYKYDQSDFKKFEKSIAAIAKVAPFEVGFKKAQRAYNRLSSSITKPSYYGRIRKYEFRKIGSNSYDPIDQIEVLADIFNKMPQASNLQISIFHPQDLIDQFRPGYVPCLSFIDLKYRAGSFNMKPFFRSCDVAEVAPFDMYHMCKLLNEIVIKCLETRSDLPNDSQYVTFIFSRIFVYKRRISALDLMDDYLGTPSVS